MKELEEIIEKAKNSKKYFEKLYQETFEMAARYFGARVRNKADVEDLLQEFYLKLYRSLKNYTEMGSFYAFFYSTARSVYLDFLRKRDFEVSYEDLSYIPDSRNGFEVSENKIDVENALTKLKEDEREIILLYFYDGLKNEEIAEIMGISLENVKIKKHRALKKLRSILENHG